MMINTSAPQPLPAQPAFCAGDRVICHGIEFPAEGVVTDVLEDGRVQVQWPDCLRTTELRADVSHVPDVSQASAYIVVWLLTVCEDGQFCTALHRTHQDAVAEVLSGWGRITEDYTDEDITEMDQDELSEVFADAGVDFRIEEIRIDLRDFPVMPGCP